MTYNEFKMCCIIFCKTFEGRKYGEVVKNCYGVDSHSIVTKFPQFGGRLFILNKDDVMWWDDDALHIYIKINTSISFENIEDFLNHFKIPLGDIV